MGSYIGDCVQFVPQNFMKNINLKLNIGIAFLINIKRKLAEMF